MRLTIGDVSLTLESDSRLFSPYNPDTGTVAMLTSVEFRPEDRILDLGCGYGLVGIYAAKRIGEDRVVMSDIDPLAVEWAKKNAQANGVSPLILQSDGFSDIEEAGFTKILSNPPYHTDFSVAKAFIEKGFNRLVVGGQLIMVTKRQDWYKNKLTAVFGGVRMREVDGYTVFFAEKRSPVRGDILKKQQKQMEKTPKQKGKVHHG